MEFQSLFPGKIIEKKIIVSSAEIVIHHDKR